jgi:hypothetical protein
LAARGAFRHRRSASICLSRLQFEWAGTLALTSQGSETLVNTSTSGTQTLNWSSKSVAMDANGSYVIIWMDGSGQSDTGIGIYGQRYNASGVAQVPSSMSTPSRPTTSATPGGDGCQR